MTRFDSVLGILATLLLATSPLRGQQDDANRREFQSAGVCSNCHITSSLEWGISRHSQLTGADSLPNCVGCHGPSPKHVADEQNIVKPDRVARGAAIAELCVECHPSGCGATGEKTGCQTCHHHHAVVSPTSDPQPVVKRATPLGAQFEAYRVRLDEGEKLLRDQKWDAARDAFASALKENPDSERAKTAIKIIDRRIKPGTPDTKIVADPVAPGSSAQSAGPTTTPAAKP